MIILYMYIYVILRIGYPIYVCLYVCLYVACNDRISYDKYDMMLLFFYFSQDRHTFIGQYAFYGKQYDLIVGE